MAPNLSVKLKIPATLKSKPRGSKSRRKTGKAFYNDVGLNGKKDIYH